MSRGRPYYKRFPSDFIAGTAMLTDAEKGVYSTIIDMLYDRGGPIEDTPADLARICGCASVKRFQGIKERLVKLGKIAVAEGHITNSRFERDMAGFAKTHSGVGEGPKDDPPNRPPDLLENNGLATPIVQSPESKGQRSDRGARAKTPLPRNFCLQQTDVDYAAEHCFSAAQIAVMLESFRDHHLARGNAMVDWQAAWRTWVRNEVKFSQNNQQRGRGGGARQTRPASLLVQVATQKFNGEDQHDEQADRDRGRAPTDVRTLSDTFRPEDEGLDSSKITPKIRRFGGNAS